LAVDDDVEDLLAGYDAEEDLASAEGSAEVCSGPLVDKVRSAEVVGGREGVASMRPLVAMGRGCRVGRVATLCA